MLQRRRSDRASLPIRRSKASSSYSSVPQSRIGSLIKSRLTRSAPELSVQKFYYNGEPLKIKEELNRSAHATVYKVSSPSNSPPSLPVCDKPIKKVNVCEIGLKSPAPQMAKPYTEIEESPKAILKICTNDGTWKSKRDFIAEEHTLLKVPPHKNIVQCYGIVTDNPVSTTPNSTIGFLMEYCANGNLQQYLIKNPNINEQHTLDMIERVIIPVVHLHKLDIIHRDIRSLNYLVTSGGNVKLCDFGLCRKNTSYNRDTTFRRARTNPLWTAPELYDYNDDFDNLGEGYSFKSDIYSITIVIWEILNTWCNKQYSLPLKGNIYQVMSKITSGKRPDVSNIPQKWIDILDKGWNEDTDQRLTIYELSRIVKKIS